MAVSAETKVGVFVIVGLALLLAGTLIVEDVNPFRRGYVLKTYFDSVEGLMPGNVVTLAGVECGKVKGMRLADGRVEVLLQINEGTIVRSDSVATVAIQTVLGGKKIALTMGSQKRPALEPGDTILSEETKGIGDLATELTQRLADFLDESAPKASTILSNLEEASNDLREGKGTLGRLLTDEALYDDAAKAISTLSAAGEKLDKIMEEKGPEITRIIEDLAEVTSHIRAGEGTLGKLLLDDEPYQNILEASRDLKEITTIAKDLAEERTGDLESFLAAGPKILEAADKLKQFIDSIDEGEGTMGLLLNDPSLYNEAKALVAEIRGAVEDIREQAPAASFVGLVLGVGQ